MSAAIPTGRKGGGPKRAQKDKKSYPRGGEEGRGERGEGGGEGERVGGWVVGVGSGGRWGGVCVVVVVVAVVVVVVVVLTMV